jgi:hypothetical protein
LVNRKDYQKADGFGHIVPPDTAMKIVEYYITRQKEKPAKPQKKVDEYGLPILPPPKRRGRLVGLFGEPI